MQIIYDQVGANSEDQHDRRFSLDLLRDNTDYYPTSNSNCNKHCRIPSYDLHSSCGPGSVQEKGFLIIVGSVNPRP